MLLVSTPNAEKMHSARRRSSGQSTWNTLWEIKELVFVFINFICQLWLRLTHWGFKVENKMLGVSLKAITFYFSVGSGSSDNNYILTIKLNKEMKSM